MVAGLAIALFTAVMTYLIIDEPIGMKMFSKISLTILITLPVIGIFSYYIGVYLSKKFDYISSRLNTIGKNRFIKDTHHDNIVDINKIHTSITDLSSSLEQSITKLQRNNKNLSSIIKSLSHDIKTPLTIIDGYLEECEDNLVTKEQMPSVIKILKKETAYLNELSSEVITYIQSQELVSPKSTIYLKDFLHTEVCPLLRVSKQVELKCEIDTDETIEFNPTALKKILINLLHNASKYTQKGTITAKVKNKNIIIRDTGIGIEIDDIERIFEPFICLDESKNREKNGFGLGLSISKNLAQNNGYDLILDAKYKNGCKFILKKSIH
jgi:two-component system sensor histidine kinase SaeS